MDYPRPFGKYVLVSPLAKGGMGELHLAFSGQAELKKLCVIKTILSHLADDEFITRFLDEAKVVVKLSHANLIPVFEAGKVDGQYFVCMEYIDGRDLRDVWMTLLERDQMFPIDVALFITKEICRGLSYVHSFGDLHLVHRDVSPPNVMLSYSGDIRLTDFGVATSTMKLQKTAPGILLGKLSYMAPEQASNDKVDTRTDLYSVGIILWEMLTGERLFPPEGDQVDRYQQVLNPTVVRPSKKNPKVSPALDLVTLRALSPEKKMRYPNAEAMRKDLTKIMAEIAPATDASAVQTLLKELFGDTIERDRLARRELLDAVADQTLEQDADTLFDEDAHGFPATHSFHDDPDDDLIESLGEDSAPHIPFGKVLEDRYRVEELIGEGGMGRVYLTTHTEIGKKVAVKVLHQSYSRMPELVSRFRREARAATRIGNPHIVEVYDSGMTEDGSFYFVMEYLTGIDLADVLGSEGRLSSERTIRIGIQICEAVAAAHEAGIVHRDLKPENIFLTRGQGTPDFVKVLDFGLALSTTLEESRKERLTNPGMAMGTPEYMAPEQAAGKGTDHRADVYAMGTLLYEMIVGEPPHVGDNILEIFNRKATQPIVPIEELRPETPPALCQVIMWALEYKAEDRPQTMAQLAYELTKLAHGRADAVASLLGIPDVSRRKTAGADVPLDAEVADDGVHYVEDVFTAVVPPPAEQAEGRKGSRWILLVMFLLVGGGLGLALFLPDLQKGPPGVTSPPEGPDTTAAGMPQPRRPADSAAAAVTSDTAAGDAATLVISVKETSAGAPATRLPLRPASNIARGRRHLRAGRFEAARQAFQAGLRKKRDRGRALLGLAEVEFQLGKYRLAEQHAREAVSISGGWRARLVLGNVHYKLRNYKKAVKMYEEVLARRSNQQEARRNLDAARRRLGQ